MTKGEAAVMITGFWEVVWATRDILEAKQEAEQAENVGDGEEAAMNFYTVCRRCGYRKEPWMRTCPKCGG